MNFKNHIGDILNNINTSHNANNKENSSNKQVENKCAHGTTKHFQRESTSLKSEISKS